MVLHDIKFFKQLNSCNGSGLSITFEYGNRIREYDVLLEKDIGIVGFALRLRQLADDILETGDKLNGKSK